MEIIFFGLVILLVCGVYMLLKNECTDNDCEDSDMDVVNKNNSEDNTKLDKFDGLTNVTVIPITEDPITTPVIEESTTPAPKKKPTRRSPKKKTPVTDEAKPKKVAKPRKKPASKKEVK